MLKIIVGDPSSSKLGPTNEGSTINTSVSGGSRKKIGVSNHFKTTKSKNMV